MADVAEKSQVTAVPQQKLSALLTVGEIPPDQLPGRIDRVTVIRIVILAALFMALQYRLIDWVVRSWMNNANWQHGPLIPLFSLYLLWARRDDLYAVARRTCWAGLPIMLLALVVEVLAISLVKNFWTLGLGMVAMLFGLVLLMGGTRLMRVVWLPVVFLALSIPLPEALYTRMAYPLQEVAAQGSVGILRLFGVEITRQASNLTLMSRGYVEHPLAVAEACAGLRLLMAFFALGVAIAYLEARPIWQRVILVAAGIPIAIVCNVLRVTITATMYYIDKPELGQGVLHAFTGMLMLIPAFAMLYLLGWILNRLSGPAKEEDEDELAPASAGEGESQ